MVAVCVIGALLMVLNERDRDIEDERYGQDPLLQIDMKSVVSLLISNEAVTVSCIKKGDDWFINAPIRCRADSGKIDYILSGMAKLTRQETISVEQRERRGLDLADYGLVDPRARLTLRHGLGEHTLLVGHDSPLGDQTYIKVAEDPEVIAIAKGILRFVPSKVDELRDRLLFHGSPDRTVRIDMHREGKSYVRLVRTEGEWEMHEPVKALADEGNVNRLLDDLYSLRIQSFVWDPEDAGLEQPRVESLWLAPDEAEARIEIWLEGQDQGRELIIGKLDDEDSSGTHVKLTELEFIYSVNPKALGFLAVDVDDLRDRAIIRMTAADIGYLSLSRGEEELVVSRDGEGAWLIEAPVRWKADQVTVDRLVVQLTQWRASSFIDGAETTNTLAAFAPPYCVLQLGHAQPAVPDDNAGDEGEPPPMVNDADSVTVSIGMWDPTGDHAPIRIEGDHGIRLVSLDAIQFPGENPADPLAYRQKTVLSLPPSAVKLISLEQEGQARTVRKNEIGEWITESGTNVVDRESIDDVLFTVSNLRALRIESQDPEEFAAFGLVPAVMAVTLGLSGEAGIQKTILIGFRSRTDGIYAMIQGQDIAFVLPTEIVDLLTKRFVGEGL